MENIIRKGIAFNPDQLKKFDKLISKKGYANRSEAIRDLIRVELISDEVKRPEKKSNGTLTVVYNHHEHHVQHELTHFQHHQGDLIKSTLHVHMDKNNCMEVMILYGKVKNIRKFADKVIAAKGVKYGKLVVVN